MAESRDDTRALIGSLLAAYTPSAQRVRAYLPALLGGETPIVALASAGTRRERMTAQGSRPVFNVDVHLFTLYASDADGWTEEDAEASLDDLEAAVCAFVDDNQKTSRWRAIRYADTSKVDTITEEGFTYRHEVIRLEVS